MKHTVTEENYLKCIYKHSDNGGMVSTNTVSRDLQTTPASVTDMLKKLAEKKLVIYQPYKGVRLTSTGKKVALQIIRKHRLWEVFLVKTLKFSWEEIHDIAEQLEHIESPELVDKLDAFLGHPKFDPHGDPIPSKEGTFEERKTITIAEAEAGSNLTLVGVLKHAPEFLQYLDRIGLVIGSKFTKFDQLEYDQSVVLKMDENRIIINGEVATNLLVMETKAG